MAKNTRTFVGVFDEEASADNAVSALEQAGFSPNQIYYSGHQAAHGGFLAGLKSIFTGEDTATSTVTDDLAAFGLSQKEVSYYENQYQEGRTVVAVQTSGKEQEAASILRSHGAHTYSTQSGAVQADRTATVGDDAVAQRKIRLREEQLQVEKQQVQTGEVGLHKEIVSERKTINVPVTHEEVYVEHRSIAPGEIEDATPIGQDEAIRVPVSKEQVNVNKNTVVTGEVAIGKRVVQETQQVSDTVKREKLNVEQQGEIPIHDSTNEGV